MSTVDMTLHLTRDALFCNSCGHNVRIPKDTAGITYKGHLPEGTVSVELDGETWEAVASAFQELPAPTPQSTLDSLEASIATCERIAGTEGD